MDKILCKQQSSVFNNEFIIDPILKMNGFDLSKKKVWVTLSRLRICQGRCKETLFKSGKGSGKCDFDLKHKPQT